MPKKILCIVGTRPEVIKMAPVVQALRAAGLEAPILATAQHRGMLDQMLGTFDLRPEWDLDAMEPSQTLASLTGRLVPSLDKIFRESGASAILAQGDTTTVFCAALAAFYARVPFGHVEAGLRSGDLSAPFPEEGMRKLSAVLTRWHFAPTERSRQSLLAEGYQDDSIHVVGNTVIDALLEVSSRGELPWPQDVPPLAPGESLVPVTLHRRENFGAPFERILDSLKTFALRHPEMRLVYPVHPNPNIQEPAHRVLAGVPNIHLIQPVDYPVLVRLLRDSRFVLTDSGGIQEEGPALGKPVIVFREVTERPEAVEAGGVVLVGSDPELFLSQAEQLSSTTRTYQDMAQKRFPYGDGQASKRITKILELAP